MNVSKYINWNLTKLAFAVFLLLLLIGAQNASGACADLYTLSATNVTSGSADVRMVVNISQPVWFEYGTTSGDYNLQTWEKTTVGNYTETIKGGYAIPGTKFYYRASCVNCSGDEYNFTYTAATPVPTTTFSTYVTEMVDAEWNLSAMFSVVGGPYEDAFAALGAPVMFVYAIIWMFMFIALWVRQENMLVPLFLFIILMPIVAFSGFLPGDWIYVSYLTVVASVGIVFYYIYKGR